MRLRLALLSGLVLAGAQGQAEGIPPAGFVAEVQGIWRWLPPDGIAAGRPVALGELLQPGSLVAEKGSTGRIVVAHANGGTTECATTSPCRRLVIEPPRLPNESFLTRLRDAFHRFREAPRSGFVATMARGRLLEDGVVTLGSAGIDLGQAVGAGPQRLFLQRATQFGEGVPAWGPGHTAEVDGARDSRTSASFPALRPGLWRVRSLNPLGEPRGEDAWLLVAPPERAPELSAAFERAARDRDAWSAVFGPDNVRGLLRAFLVELALGLEEAPGLR